MTIVHCEFVFMGIVSSRHTHTRARDTTRPTMPPSQQPKNEHENAAMESTKNYIACNKLSLRTTLGSSTLQCRLLKIKIGHKIHKYVAKRKTSPLFIEIYYEFQSRSNEIFDGLAGGRVR